MSSIEDDIVYRLRKQAKAHPELAELLRKAADDIEYLRETVEWLFKN